MAAIRHKLQRKYQKRKKKGKFKISSDNNPKAMETKCIELFGSKKKATKFIKQALIKGNDIKTRRTDAKRIDHQGYTLFVKPNPTSTNKLLGIKCLIDIESQGDKVAQRLAPITNNPLHYTSTNLKIDPSSNENAENLKYPELYPPQFRFNPDKPILILGEMDFSFALDIASKIGGANIIATAYYHEEAPQADAPLTQSNIEMFKKLGGKGVAFRVDARKLEEGLDFIGDLKFHRILFGFPRCAHNPNSVRHNIVFMKQVFHSVAPFLSYRGQFQIFLHINKSGHSPLDQWKMSYPNWSLIHESIFTPKQMADRFPLYQSHDKDANKWMPFRTALCVFALKKHLESPAPLLPDSEMTAVHTPGDTLGVTPSELSSVKKYHRKENVEKLPVDIVGDAVSCAEVLSTMCRRARGKGVSDSYILGMDCRWTLDDSKYRKSHHMKLSVLVFCSTHCIVIVRLSKMKYELPSSVKAVLENQQIIKCGVGIADTCNRLLTDFGIRTRGAIDVDDAYRSYRQIPPRIARLQHIQSVKERMIKNSTLRTLYEEIMSHRTVEKSYKVEGGNWNLTQRMSMEQIECVSNDAVVALRVFWKLIKEIAGGFVEKGEWMRMEVVKEFMDCNPLEIVKHEYRGRGKTIKQQDSRDDNDRNWRMMKKGERRARGDPKCVYCGKRGHWGFQCDSEEAQKANGQWKEEETSYHERNTKWEKSVAEKYNIKMSKKKEKVSKAKGCRNCGKLGHWSTECPLRRQVVSFIKEDEDQDES